MLRLPLQMTGRWRGQRRSSSTPAFSVRTVRGKVRAALEQSAAKPAKRRRKNFEFDGETDVWRSALVHNDASKFDRSIGKGADRG